MTQLRRFAASWHPLSSVTYTTLFLLLLWTTFQRFIAGQSDPNRCRALLTDGAWSPATSSSHDTQKWEPNGCRMVEYSSHAIHDCLAGRKFVLAGDSTIRQIFWAAARKLDPKLAAAELNEIVAADEKHRDLSFYAEGVNLEFIWDPWLNSTNLVDTLEAFRALPTSAQESTLVKKEEQSPALIVLGAPGLWAARYGGDEYMTLFRDGISTVSSYLSLASEHSTSRSSSLSALPNSNDGYNSGPNHILLTPVQEPAYNSLSNKRTETITPERIDEMNDYLSHLPSNQTSHVVWAFNRMTAFSDKSFEDDGLHVEDAIADRKIDIVLNAHCNNPAVLEDRAFKGTCCVEEPSNYLFNIALIVLCAVMLYTPKAQSMPKIMRPELLTAIRDILVTLAWCWLCDGTLQFSKLERHYHQGAFIAICLLWIVGSSIVFRKHVGSASEVAWSTGKDPKKDIPHRDENKFLSRDQTDEMKGLMQGIILLYHFNYASQTLWVYKLVRVLISMYFFLSAYGHTLYILRTRDYSFKRVAMILFRINALSALLPYMMGTSYSSYYFAPAVTFYYLVIYIMLRTLRENNDDPWPLGMKVMLTAGFTSAFIMTPGYLEMATQVLSTVFRMSFDVHELRFRLALDRHIVFVGVTVASLVHTATMNDSRELFSTKGSPPLFDSGRTRFWIICSGGLALFLLVTQWNFSSKQSYNAAHPYISWIPVLSLITLRNLYTPAQNLFLGIPAALGRISLETYVLQYHIWLGGDATARLTLGGFENASFPLFLVEKALITTLFIGLAALTHRATRTLTGTLSEFGFLAFLAALWVGNLIYT
ncbi:10 TM acyl transferase domain found in Cas1p-domain-containing protein [Xylaria bambusicola]|uniref:10 TM acyl transferase domain found in Cas1p-domain-containing protein n=1 Tax=Xylaria bambusicola TaxID=326684 RepID=UPI002007347D|nr:10 TM acyl transferase domain found in Cas1p-domain-containing protein [Xylaria bambusicola]KAI0512629.1 10 TM acyl transferase domain found in Cas1p-domain-containing protein [Xylaria bambusicola]